MTTSHALARRIRLALTALIALGVSHVMAGSSFFLDGFESEPPVAVADNGATDEDTILNVPAPGVLENDSDPDDDTLTVSAFDAVSTQGATVTVSPDGSYSYDPTAAANLQALNPGEDIDDTFGYTVTDGSHFDSTTVTINVTGVDEAPVLMSVQVEIGDVLTTVTDDGAILSAVDDDTSVVLVFSEAVNLANDGAMLDCDTSGVLVTPTNLSIAGNGTDQITLTRASGTFSIGETCSLGVDEADITDTDSDDPPDVLETVTGMYAFEFGMEANDDFRLVTAHIQALYDDVTPGGNDDGLLVNDACGGCTLTFGETVATDHTAGTTATFSDGAIVTVEANGSLTYNPPPGEGDGAMDTFVYRLTAANDEFVEATVTMTIEGPVVWFVDESNTSGIENGTLAFPFTDFGGPSPSFEADAQDSALAEAGDAIFIDGGSYTCGVTLLDAQQLYGDGSSLDLSTLTGISPRAESTVALPAPSGLDPVLSNPIGTCITILTDNILRGFTVGDTSAGHWAIDTSQPDPDGPDLGNPGGERTRGGVAFGTLSLDELSTTGTGGVINLFMGLVTGSGFDSVTTTASDTAILLESVDGTLAVGGSTAMFGATKGIVIANSPGTFTFNNTMISIAGNAVEVTVQPGIEPIVSFTGGLDINTVSGTGIMVDGGANLNVSGGLDIDTVSGSGLVASGGTILDVMGEGNSINTGSGPVLDLFGVTIGASGINFENLVSTQQMLDVPIWLDDLDGGEFHAENIYVFGTFGGNSALIIGSESDATFNLGMVEIDGSGSRGICVCGGGIGPVTIESIEIDNTSGPAISIEANTNNVSINGGSIGATFGTAQDSVRIANGSGDVSIAASVQKTSGDHLVVVRGRTDGTVTLSGNLSSTMNGDGILVENNTGGVINFTGTTKIMETGNSTAVRVENNSGATINFTNGGLDIDTTSGVGFNATGGGTLTVTGSGNTINTATSQILNLDGIDLGGVGVSFDTLGVTGTVGTTAININNVDNGIFNGGDVSIGGTSVGDGLFIGGGSSATFNFNSATIGISDTIAGDSIDIDGSGNGPVTFNTVDLDGAAEGGIEINSNTNAINILGGSVGATNDPAGDAVNINGGSGDITIAASLTKTTANNVLEVLNRTGGSVTVSGDISATGANSNGIDLANNTAGTINISGTSKVLSTGTNTALSMSSNTGSTINFTNGGLDIDTTSGTGFTATGGGTLNVTDGSNTINTGSGTGLNIADTDIGLNGLFLESVSANGATNGIVLDNTGSMSGLTITGDGTNTQNSSGGTIINTTGDAISLQDTHNTVLNQIAISDTGRHGVSGLGITNLTVNDSTFDNVGNATGENVFDFQVVDNSGESAISGNLVLNNVDVTNFYDTGLAVFNEFGTVSIDMDNTSFSDNSAIGGGAAIDIDLEGTAGASVDINGGVFDSLEGDLLFYEGGGSGGQDINIHGVTSTNGGGPDNLPNAGGIHIRATSGELVTFDITGSTLTDFRGDAITISTSFPGGFNSSAEGRIGGPNPGDSNTISGISFGDGVQLSMEAGGDFTVLVQGNDIGVDNTGGGFNGITGDGVNISQRTDGTLNLTIEDNTIANTLSQAIQTYSDNSNGFGGETVVSNIRIADNALVNIDTDNNNDELELRTNQIADACYHVTGNDNGSAGSPGVIDIVIDGSSSAEITQASITALSTDNNGATIVGDVPGFNAACTNPTLPANP